MEMRQGPSIDIRWCGFHQAVSAVDTLRGNRTCVFVFTHNHPNTKVLDPVAEEFRCRLLDLYGYAINVILFADLYYIYIHIGIQVYI